MANYYVRSGAGGAGTGADWANAYTTLVAALSGKTNADVLWVADDHAESTAGAVLLAMPTTPGIQILGVNTHTVEPPTGLVTSPTATVAVGAASALLSTTGFGYIYGIHFLGATNTSSASSMQLLNAAAAAVQVFDTCKFEMRTASAAAILAFGPAGGGSNLDVNAIVKNSVLKFSTVVGVFIRVGRHYFSNVTIDSAGTTPTTLMSFINAGNGTMLWEASDLTGEAFTNIVSQAAGNTYDVMLRDCKLPAAVNVVTGTNPSSGGMIVRMHNCDSADTQLRFSKNNWQGSVVNQVTTRYRIGGATQAGNVPFSMLMNGSANSTLLYDPLSSLEFSLFNTTLGASKTLTVEILRDNVTALTDAQIWLEVMYLGTSGFPLGTIASDRVANVMTAAANQASSAASWDTTGMSNPNTQKLEVTFTPQENGYYIARVYLAANTSVYVDPYITVT